MSEIHVKIITHQKVVYEGNVKAVYVDTAEGRMGILPNHIPITAILEIGIAKLITESEPVFITIMGGIMHFKENEAVILTDIAELGHDIDLARANDAMLRSKARLESKNETINILRAQIALKKAVTRIRAKGKPN